MEVTVPFNHITLGNVLEIAVMIAGGLSFIYTMRGALQNLGTRMGLVETEVKKLGEILVTLGRYEERFLRNESDIWDLKHGRGYINEPIENPSRGRYAGSLSRPVQPRGDAPKPEGE